MLKTAQYVKRLWKPPRTITRNAYSVAYTHFLQNLPQSKSKVLPNGLTVVSEERECCNVCTGLFFDAGSRYESLFENGITHFFEHIAFKGTNLRSKTCLEDVMSNTGARFKCFTTREMVGYYAECLSQDVPLIIEILSDCIYNNAYSAVDIETQKRTVYGEMVEHDQDPHELVNDYLHRTAFQGTPLAQTVMGISTNLYNFSADTIDRYLRRCFDPTKTVFVSVGGIKHEQAVALAECYLCKFEPTKCSDTGPYRFTGSEIRYRDDTLPAVNVAIAVEAPSFCDPDRLILDVAATIVGGWDRSQSGGRDHASRAARIASGGHLCDSYKSFNITYKDTGLWGIQFMCGPMTADDVLAAIQDEWMYICTIVTDKEVERAKHQLKSEILWKTESCRGACIDLGRWYLYNGYRPPLYELMGRIDKIYTQDVHNACMTYLYDKCPAVAAVGPSEALPDYTRIRSGMYWLRL